MSDCNNKKLFTITFGPKKAPFSINNGVVPGSWVDTTGDDGRPEHVLIGIKVHTNMDGEGAPIVGTMPNNGELIGTIDGINEETYILPLGYISGGSISLTDDIRSYLAAISGEEGSTIISQILALESLTSGLGDTIEWLGGTSPDPLVLSNISDSLKWMLRFETEDGDVLTLENGDILCRERVQGGF